MQALDRKLFFIILLLETLALFTSLMAVFDIGQLLPLALNFLLFVILANFKLLSLPIAIFFSALLVLRRFQKKPINAQYKRETIYLYVQMYLFVLSDFLLSFFVNISGPNGQQHADLYMVIPMFIVVATGWYVYNRLQDLDKKT